MQFPSIFLFPVMAYAAAFVGYDVPLCTPRRRIRCSPKKLPSPEWPQNGITSGQVPQMPAEGWQVKLRTDIFQRGGSSTLTAEEGKLGPHQ